MEEDNEKSFPFSSPIISINNIKFSSREIDILACVVGGRTAKKIAFFLSLSPRTVEHYIRNITLKLECNSRENLIDFVEKSDKTAVIKDHYINLLLHSEFENSLKKISQLHHQPISCWVLIEEAQEIKKSFLSLLEKHLSLAGINVSIRASKELELLSQNASESPSVDYLICINSETFMAKLHREKTLQKIVSTLKGFLFLSLEENAREENSDIFTKLSNIMIIKEKNYYLLALEILKNFLPQSNLETIRGKFEGKYGLMDGAQRNTPSQLSPSGQHGKTQEIPVRHIMAFLKSLFLKKSTLYSLSAVLIIGLLSIWFLSMGGAKQENGFKGRSYTQTENQRGQEAEAIRSDLVIPTELALLNRSELIAQIDDKFKGQEKIQTISLIGMGGAGKTTLARQYAHQQKANVIWEINAETHQSLIHSLENLAYALSRTEEDKKLLREVKEIKNSLEREMKIINFVKAQLKLLSNWVLIYDNVENFADIQNYFPQDNKIWGQGKIILTTRNANIQNNSQISHAIFIRELTKKQKLDLFTKIMGRELAHLFTGSQNAKAQTFLENIPPFPLDISVAAYYLKTTNISYEDYLENLKNYDSEFSSVQKNLLKEAGSYLKTRYSIITLSLENLIKTHKDFGELLLFISLLDSQKIPKDLLDKHKNKSIVDNFICHLKKYSFITTDSTDLSLNSTFSIHRSTQAITLAYLTKKLNLAKGHKLIALLSKTLTNYALSAIEEDNFPKLEYLMIQYDVFLKHRILIDAEIEASIKCILGNIYCYLSDFIKSKNILEDNLFKLNKNYVVIAPTLTCLGIIERELCHYEKAKKLLRHSIVIYENHLPEYQSGIARAIVYLGDVYRLLEDCEKAQHLLEKGVHIYKNLSINHIGIVRGLTYLALIYRMLGFYEKSTSLLEQALEAHIKKYSYNHISTAQVLAHLGNSYKKLGNDKKAKNFLAQSLAILKKLFSENHLRIAWVSLHLGDAYWRLGEYEKAKNMLKESIIIYKKHYSADNTWIVRATLKLANIEHGLGNQEIAKSLFEMGLKNSKKNYSKEDNSEKFLSLIQLVIFMLG